MNFPSSHAIPDDVVITTRQGLFHADMPLHRIDDRVDEAWLCPVVESSLNLEPKIVERQRRSEKEEERFFVFTTWILHTHKLTLHEYHRTLIMTTYYTASHMLLLAATEDTTPPPLYLPPLCFAPLAALRQSRQCHHLNSSCASSARSHRLRKPCRQRRRYERCSIYRRAWRSGAVCYYGPTAVGGGSNRNRELHGLTCSPVLHSAPLRGAVGLLSRSKVYTTT
jgi:hypothetical protein